MYDPAERMDRLWREWRYCRKCELSERRVLGEFPITFGEGSIRGIMFIGEGPGKDEEKSGRPFVGKSGKMFRAALQKLGLLYVSYISNAVCCRSCGPVIGPEGTPMVFRGVQVIKDIPPKVSQMQACLPRLYEQIYVVDPMLIVTLGKEAAQLLLKRPVKVMTDSGIPRVITIPGHSHVPQLTEKKRAWSRKQGGVLVAPVEQNQVQYLMIPIVHPAFALRKSADLRMGNPMDMFIDCMKLVANFYRHNLYEMSGEQIPEEDLTADYLLASSEYGEE